LLIDWLIEQNCPVIHLVRENIFENYVSNVVAHQTRVWLVEKSEPVTACSVRLKVNDTLRSIQTFKTQIDVFRKWLEPTNHIELTYESLIDRQSGLSADVIRETCNLVGIEEALNITIPTKKTGPSLVEMIENYESEIAPALIASGYCDWLNQNAA
jgi:LPS sulfotransferase NodH